MNVFCQNYFEGVCKNTEARNDIDTFSQTTFSNAFQWMNFSMVFHWFIVIFFLLFSSHPVNLYATNSSEGQGSL